MKTLGKIIVGFFVFWYDFLIGDCWQIAAGVAVVLTAAILLLRARMVSPSVLPVLVAVAVMALVVISAGLEWRKKARKQNA